MEVITRAQPPARPNGGTRTVTRSLNWKARLAGKKA